MSTPNLPLIKETSTVIRPLSHFFLRPDVANGKAYVPVVGSRFEPRPPGRITEAHFDLTVDVDSAIEDSLGADFRESDQDDTDYDAANVPPLDRDYASDPEGFKAYYEQARATWTDEELEVMKHTLKSRGMEAFLKEYVVERQERVEKLLFAFGVILSREQRKLDDLALLPVLKAALTRALRRRPRVKRSGRRLQTVVDKIRKSRRIMVLTGAGISVSCGIPDFRSRNGLYSQLFCSAQYELDDPQQIKIYPSNFAPSPCHRFIKALERRNKLLRNYTQNIDTLEAKAGIRRVLQCHGSFATASCINCRERVPGDAIKDDLLAQRVPLCKLCNANEPVAVKPKRVRKKKKKKRTDGWESEEPEEPAAPLPAGIMKPDITFFGEKLANEFDRQLFDDVKRVDLLLIIGTSLKVRPVSEILTHIPHRVPIFVINKTPITHIKADYQLLGDADVIVEYLADKLEWDISPETPLPKSARTARKKRKRTERRVAGSGIIMFEGAEGGKYVADLTANKPGPYWDWTSDGDDADSECDEPPLKKKTDRGRFSHKSHVEAQEARYGLKSLFP
ncbi:SIR2-domain-containing protein [Phellopilus nigrolimitatus]|nr:SIR2-domain-containing protein [Phellopilus nigrolimitatus]